MPVCRFLETSYTMKFFRTASEFFLCFSGKIPRGSPLVDFSAEFSSYQHISYLEHCLAVTKADFWEAPPIPLCVQALALQFLR